MAATLGKHTCGLVVARWRLCPGQDQAEGQLLPVPVKGSRGGFQQLFSFAICGRTKQKSILNTCLPSNCFSATGQNPPLILQFALITLGEASTSLRGKSVKCDMIKIPFTCRYLQKILQSK